MTPVLLETHKLTKRYGEIAAVVDCDLRVHTGEVFGLLGPNGAGKTTLLRLLMGFLQPSSGHARIAGLDCYRQSVAVHGQVAYLPAAARSFPRMRGRDVLRFFSGIHPRASLDRALTLADRLGLDLARQVAYCSTGMRQKLALAATLAIEAPLLILDEPTSNLDPTVRSEVMSLVREAKRAGQTVILSSHVLSESEDACDRVCILRQGSLVHTEVIAELRRQHRIRAQLTGPLPAVPPALAGDLSIQTDDGGNVTILTATELAPLLGWLATAPLAEVRIEPVGLAAVYEKFHAPEIP